MSAFESVRTVYTVSELNGSVRLLLSSHFGAIWVEGEVSNLASPSSGHLYFTLKDSDAQVRCAMFRGNARGLGLRLEGGMQVLVRAQVSLYEPRGDYQLIVDYLEEAGDGALRRAFELLKQKLAAEGLFDPERKKPIPALPQTLGVITSPTGAAIRDILTVLKRRFPGLPVIVYPVKVQGSEAKHEIVRALALADELSQCDVLILARGGGALEDLWAFNEEIVARAIAACSIPVVTGIGHETDTTIADWVADLRAATPSAAAAAVSPDQAEWLARFERLERQLQQSLRNQLSMVGQRLQFLQKRLVQAHPEKVLQRHAQRLDELELRLRRSIQVQGERRAGLIAGLVARLYRHHPRYQLELAEIRVSALEHRLKALMIGSLERQHQRVILAGQRLQSVSPLATLSRGYAIASRKDDGKLIHCVNDVKAGDLIETRLADGTLTSCVE